MHRFVNTFYQRKPAAMNNLNNRLTESAKSAALKIRNFVLFLTRRAQSDMIFRVASSLSYTSLIAIVPLVAIGLAIFSVFPVFSEVRVQFQEMLLKNFVPNTEQEIILYLNQFVNATAKLTTVGVIGIVITAILLLSTIENGLNFIFKVYKPRSIRTKITLYWTVITLGPLLLGTGFSMRGYVFALQKFMPEYFINAEVFFTTIIPSLFTILSLVILYVLVPNKKVKISNAVAGALVASVLFYIMRKIFALVISFSSIYTTLYGALAIIPIMLIWLYLIWVVVIFGAVVTAALGEFREGKEIVENQSPNFHHRKKNKHTAKKFLPKEQN